VVQAFDQFAGREVYQGKEGGFIGIGGKTVSDADKWHMLDNLTKLVISPGFASMAPEGQRTAVDVFEKHATNDIYHEALGKLIAGADFRGLASDTQLAVLSQAGNYPDIRSIKNLSLLTTRGWFRKAPLPDQQRSAKIIAFVSQYAAGDVSIINNTLRYILSNNKTRFEMAS
jgi:hypothetical protein